MELNTSNLNKAFEDTVPYDGRHFGKLFGSKGMFLGAFVSFLRATNDLKLIKENFEDLKVWFLLKVTEKITGNSEVDLEFEYEETYDEWLIVEKYTLQEFLIYIKR